jgi:diguanylate cyclase (GGDEF)-like protein
MVDLDNFKKFKDTFGHVFGDRVLQETALAIKNSIKKTDKLIRYSGDKFLVIFPNIIKQKDLIEIAFKIRSAVSSLDIDGQSISVSIGVSKLNLANNKDSIIEKVDRALYMAR